MYRCMCGYCERTVQVVFCSRVYVCVCVCACSEGVVGKEFVLKKKMKLVMVCIRHLQRIQLISS